MHSQMSEIFATKLRRNLRCVKSFDLSTTISKSVPNHAVKSFAKKIYYNIQCCRAFASMWTWTCQSSPELKVPRIASNILRNKAKLDRAWKAKLDREWKAKISRAWKAKIARAWKAKIARAWKAKKMRDAGGAIGKTQNSRERRKRQKVHELCEQRRDKMTKFWTQKRGLTLVF